MRMLLPNVYVWSFEVGAIKPDPKIYSYLCTSLECAPSQMLMIGDLVEADYEGPKRAGLQALHLSRNGKISEAKSINSIDEVLAKLISN